jgi:nicotinamidase-related amidase
VSFGYVPQGTVPVPAITFKDRLRLPTADSSLVIVDMQNDLVKPEGNLVVPAAEPTIPGIGRLLQAAREHEVRIAYTQDTQVPADPEFDIWPEHCVKGTWGWELVEEQAPRKDDLVGRKNRYDGFYGT